MMEAAALDLHSCTLKVVSTLYYKQNSLGKIFKGLIFILQPS